MKSDNNLYNEWRTCTAHQDSTKSRVRTPDSEGNQMHSSIVWTLRIPKMQLLLKSNYVQVLVLKNQGCQISIV